MSLLDPPGPAGHLGDALSALLDAELLPVHVEAVRAHLARCQQCGEELLAVGQARAWVRALPPVDTPPGFYGRLASEWSVGAGRPVPSSFGRSGPPVVGRARLRRRVGLVAVGTAAAAAAVLGVGVPRESPPPPVARSPQAWSGSPSAATDVLGKLAPMGVPVSFGR